MIRFICLMVVIFCTSLPVFAGVVDNKTTSQSMYHKPSSSELGNTKLFNNINALEINLRAVQEAFDTSKNTDNVVYFSYRADFTAKLRLRVGMRSMIHLDSTEEIKSYIVGNPSIFKVEGISSNEHKVGIIPNILTLKAIYAGADTNLTVLTKSGRVYNFYLRSDPVDSKTVPHLTAYMQLEDSVVAKSFQFVKKVEKEVAKESNFKFTIDNIKTAGDYLKTIDSNGIVNTKYKISGDAQIAPFAVYDDGTFTYFDYRYVLASDRLPVVYKVVDKYDTIVNFRMDKGFLIAESLSSEGWTLRNGQKTVCVKTTQSLAEVHNQPNRPQMKYGVDE